MKCGFGLIFKLSLTNIDFFYFILTRSYDLIHFFINF